MRLIGIVENDFLLRAYAIYGWFKRCPVTVFGQNSSGFTNYMNRYLIAIDDRIGTYHGAWYKIQKWMVCDSSYIKHLDIENKILVKIQCKIFKSKKVVNYYKHYLSHIEYKLLRDKILAGDITNDYCFILPNLYSYRLLVKCYLKKDEYILSNFLSVLHIVFACYYIIGYILKILKIKLKINKQIKGLVLKKLAWGFGGVGLKDDMLVDNSSIYLTDMVYYVSKNTIKSEELKLLKLTKNLNINLIKVSNEFNINKKFFDFILSNVILGMPLLFYSIIFKPFIFYGLISFLIRSMGTYKLLSFCDTKYYWSVGNWDDIVETIIANRYKMRMFMYSWSDCAQCYLYTFTYTVQDDVFMWGPIEEKYMIQKSLHENMFTIGCLFSNNFIETNKEKVCKNFNLDPNKPVVVFFDSPVNNRMRFPQSLFDQFREIILLVEQKYPNVQIVLKPKTVTDEYIEYFRGSSVKLFDGKDIYLGDIINIATLNVGMGIVAPITISLIMNKPGIFFETAGNYDSPFAKYEGELVFRDQESLLNKIDQILTGQFSSIIINELKDYNVPGSNPVEILREYVTTGKVEEKYRLH
tara:strand:+ start:707 stop:2449 length:1743 start_codon:yes stop_codon:yes gene_type:complete